MPTLEEEYKQYQGAQGVNSMYDAQKEAKLAGLESAYQQSRSDAEAAKAQIPGQYQQRANDLSVQYERNRRNLNQQAAANGLNTGAGSQMQLALGGQYQRDYGNIRTAQQQALDAADKGIRDLEAAYRTSVQQAVADNDYQRAQALLAEYKERYQQQLQQAQTLASYGNFSGYAGVPGYSQEQIDSMRNAWAASNPDLAYNTGAITPEQYHNMTGRWPAGYTPPSSGGGYLPYTPPKKDEPTGVRPGSLEAALANGDITPEQYRSATGKNPDGYKGPVSGNMSYSEVVQRLSTTSTPDEATALMDAFLNGPYYGSTSQAQRQNLAGLYNSRLNAKPYNGSSRP